MPADAVMMVVTMIVVVIARGHPSHSAATPTSAAELAAEEQAVS